ncbi:MAG: hypothetical protein GX557_03060, partial [Chloroflexi bacterium]|nr:hypothetical protein [Chloroflexota bacterium]
MIDRALFESLLARIQHVFSDWSGVDDPRFVENEVAYKRAAITTAQRMLSEPELRRL